MCVVVRCSGFQCVPICGHVLRHKCGGNTMKQKCNIYVCCSALQLVLVCSYVSPCVASEMRVVAALMTQYIAAHCNTLRRTATHCNTHCVALLLQHVVIGGLLECHPQL